MAKFLVYIIRLYQRLSLFLFPVACRFYPSCSQYALEAIQKYGALKGGVRAIFRICRCSPLSRGGYHPVV